MDKLQLARQRAVDEGWQPAETAPKDGTVIIIRYMHGYVSAEWSAEKSDWVATPEVGGGIIPGPIYGWCPARQRGEHT
jgi:hypothetical protein